MFVRNSKLLAHLRAVSIKPRVLAPQALRRRTQLLVGLALHTHLLQLPQRLSKLAPQLRAVLAQLRVFALHPLRHRTQLLICLALHTHLLQLPQPVCQPRAGLRALAPRCLRTTSGVDWLQQQQIPTHAHLHPGQPRSQQGPRPLSLLG